MTKKDKKTLSEGTSFKNKDKPKQEDRVPVWVKKSTLDYEEELFFLQRELLKLQEQVKASGRRVLILFEGRDAAGKGGIIKRFTQHLNPRGVRVVALGVPSDTEQTQWYFQRYAAHLPAAGEMVLFDRSWYNRAMVEPVMGFCSDEQNKRFLKDVPLFEQLLVKDGIELFKFYLSISRNEQKRRFESRKDNPLKQFKFSPVDAKALEMWDAYTVKKFQMLSESNRTLTPWTILRADNKKAARINAFKTVLQATEYDDKADQAMFQIDPNVAISGIDELKHMEDFMLNNQGKLMG